MNKQNDTPTTTTLVFETSHEARTQAADHLETIVREAGMTRTDAYRDNAKGTDHARYTLEVPADQADDTARAITTDLAANGIRTTWYDASEPGPDPNQTYQPGDLVTNNDDTYEVEKVVHRKANGWEIYQIRNTRTGERRTVHEDELDRAEPTETPEAAAARFWREGSEAQGGGTPEFEAKDVEEWLTPITDPDRREATKEAIYDRAEPMNLPEHIMPRFDERQLRDILGDTQTDLDAEREEHEETKRERDEARKKAERLQKELTATIDAHTEKPETPNSRDWAILKALLTADPSGHAADGFFYTRHVIEAKARTNTPMDDDERDQVANLISDANDSEIPWTHEQNEPTDNE